MVEQVRRRVCVIPWLVVCLWSAWVVMGPASVASGMSGRIRKPVTWSFEEVGVGQRSLKVAFAYGGCETNPAVSATETRTTVTVVVTLETPPPGSGVACPLFERVGAPIWVHLAAPLAGRRVLGGSRSGAQGNSFRV
jgi:hypothetical protein